MNYYVDLLSSYGIIGWVVLILILIIIIVLIASLLSGPSRNRRKENKDTAEEIIKIKYARGDIDKREYDEKRKNLRR